MLLKIPDVLSAVEVQGLLTELGRQSFQDGTVSGHKALKRNLQLAGQTPEAQKLLNVVMRALVSNRAFTSFAQPRNFQLVFNRYEEGMFYKDHMDAALMGNVRGQPIRTDLSFTVFLTAPAAYEGGDFIIRTNFGDLRVRGEAGSAICYPSNMLHRVETVTKGARWAAVGWVQSFVRGLDQRLALYELDELRHRITGNAVDHPEDEHFGRLRENLLRLWVEV
jgi:PKHD-type hydroxylase